MREDNRQKSSAGQALSPGRRLQEGAAAAWPICLGYIPVGLALGVLGQQADLPWWAVGLMSVLVFAGSAQFIGVAMLAAGASALPIILTTLVVNLRHALMSSALAVYMQGVSRWFLTLFAYGITDESFALNMTRFREGNWGRWRESRNLRPTSPSLTETSTKLRSSLLTSSCNAVSRSMSFG